MYLNDQIRKAIVLIVLEHPPLNPYDLQKGIETGKYKVYSESELHQKFIYEKSILNTDNFDEWKKIQLENKTFLYANYLYLEVKKPLWITIHENGLVESKGAEQYFAKILGIEE